MKNLTVFTLKIQLSSGFLTDCNSLSYIIHHHPITIKSLFQITEKKEKKLDTFLKKLDAFLIQIGK
ncbi:hypothetical protein HOF65_08490 [bacterium]|jgi:transcriptional regulator of NAD metabolism|nr:hypothetical protein [bacterium]MBT3853916.1 hypothetical protein [bacterium]MBT4633312.1 hypothetical protein [bacterium]MBT6778444.1 hypothetical protein [bacterium]